MKKLLLIVASLGLALTSLTAQSSSQTKTKRHKNRIEGGLNLSSHIGLIDDAKVRFDDKTGFHLGLYREYQFKKNFYLLYGAGFRFSRSRAQELAPYSTKAIYKVDIIEKAIIAPIRAGYTLKLKRSAIDFEFGLYYGRILRSKFKLAEVNPNYIITGIKDDLIESGSRNRNEFGLTSRIAYVYKDRFVIFGESNNSLSNSFRSIVPEHKASLSSLETIFGIGIRF